MSVDLTDVLEREIRIDARPETVFRFLTEPDLMVRWIGVDATLEPVPGGVYRVVVNDRDTVLGEYVEVVPHTRVVFTWGFDGGELVAPGASTVEVTLAPDGGGTLLRLVHRNLTADARERHAIGWEHYLDRLRRAAGGDDPGADPWVAAR